MSAAPLNWVKIANNANELSAPSGSIFTITIAERTVCIYSEGGKIYAFSSKCPHAGYELSEGSLTKEGIITCALHGYKFCTRTGKNVSGEGYRLFTYPIENRPDGIYIGFRKTLF